MGPFRGFSPLLAPRRGQRFTALMRAAEHGRADVVKTLIISGADMEATLCDGFTAVMISCEFGEKAVLELLMFLGASIESREATGLTPLAVAAYFGRAS